MNQPKPDRSRKVGYTINLSEKTESILREMSRQESEQSGYDVTRADIIRKALVRYTEAWEAKQKEKK